MGQSASVVPFSQREGIRGEDKYAATTFRRVELQEDDLNILFSIFMKIKEKNPYPKMVDPQSICKYFGVNKSDFVLKLFDAVDFDGNESIDFKEFTLGLWNFLSLTSSFLADLVFYIYDPLKFNLLDMKELQVMLEATHCVQLSTFTPSLNAVLKNALLNNKASGITSEAFSTMCKDTPFILKPIVSLQTKLRKKIVGVKFWRKLEFRRSASIRGNLRDVNYVYIVNEETEIWRKKDFELGIGREYELTEMEIALKEKQEKIKNEKEALEFARLRELEEQAEKEMEEMRLQEEEEEARQVQDLKDKIAANKDIQGPDDDEYVAKHRMKMSEVEGREVAMKKGVMKEYDDFAETVFMVAEGKFVPIDVPIEAVTVFEFPGEEKFVFGIVTDNKKKDEKVVMVNRDLSRRRIKGSDLSKINSNFKFVGYSKLTVKTLPEQIRLRNNIPLLSLCNNKMLIPDVISEHEYLPGQWSEEMRAIVLKSTSNKGETYLDNIDMKRKFKNNQEEEVQTSQDDRVKTRANQMIIKQLEARKSMINSGTLQPHGRKSINKRHTVNAGNGLDKDEGKDPTIPSNLPITSTVNKSRQGRSTINSGSRQGRSTINSGSRQGRSTINSGSRQGRSTINSGSGSNLLSLPAGGKLAPLST